MAFAEKNWGSIKFENTPFYKESVEALSKLKTINETAQTTDTQTTPFLLLLISVTVCPG